MIAKTNCLNCGNGIEFDPAQLGGEKFLVINCPHCGKETVLTLQKDESPKVIYAQPPPQPQKKSHGVFYYVFWGVVSLFATFFILGVLFWILVGVGFVAIPAFIEGRNAGIAAKQDKENVVTNAAPDGAKNILVCVSTNMSCPRRWTKPIFAALTPNRIALNFPA